MHLSGSVAGSAGTAYSQGLILPPVILSALILTVVTGVSANGAPTWGWKTVMGTCSKTEKRGSK